jgi:predicted O-linked N-acetylglucosamine transferase (SPINDLY family)
MPSKINQYTNPFLKPRRLTVASDSSVLPNLQSALSLHQQGQFDQAEAIYRQILKITPQNSDALHLLGVIALQAGNYQDAVDMIGQAIDINPNVASFYFNLGIALKDLKQYVAAVASWDKAIALKPDYADAYSNRGVALQELKEFGAAVASFDKAVALKSDYAEAFCNRGVVLKEMSQLGAAVASYDKAIALKPDYAEAYSNRGLALQELKQFEVAIASFDRAISLKPELTEAYFNRGYALQELKKFGAAVASYDKAIALNSDYADAYSNRGFALQELKQFSAAIASYDRAFDINPEMNFLRGMRQNARMLVCDWSNLSNSISDCESEIVNLKPVLVPFTALTLFDKPELHLLSSKIFVDLKWPKSNVLGDVIKRSDGGKVRLGYFSADLYYHPVAMLLVEQLENHDKSKFELFAFSFRSDTKDPMRNRLEAAFDHFIEVDKMSDLEVAQLSRQLGIDIALDLGGHTKDSRTGIFAARAAPIQVSHLGFPGSMGADYIDYVLSDAHLLPESSAKYFTEKIAYVPCAFTYDRQRQISTEPLSRAQYGLPESGFVFTCQNGCQKIMPEVFDIWMEILKAVPESVLWLLEPNHSAKKNLIKEAQARGIESERLVFTQRETVEPEQENARIARYLASYKLADLFLDTWPYNAGTTSIDALWAGLPVLTKEGAAWSARMAANALQAIEAPELITYTTKEYRDLAVELANNSQKLNLIKSKLQENRLTSALFDPVGNTQHIEAAYAKMYARYQADLAPDHLRISA